MVAIVKGQSTGLKVEEDPKKKRAFIEAGQNF
jgi:hypothetical protein